MRILSIDKNRLNELNDISKKYMLDFDDSYQLFVAQTHKLQLISFDKDFDKIEKLRKEPRDIL